MPRSLEHIAAPVVIEIAGVALVIDGMVLGAEMLVNAVRDLLGQFKAGAGVVVDIVTDDRAMVVQRVSILRVDGDLIFLIRKLLDEEGKPELPDYLVVKFLRSWCP